MLLKIIYSLIAISLSGVALYFIWAYNFNVYEWLKKLIISHKLLLAVILILLIVIPRVSRHSDNFKRLSLFLFSSEQFINLTVNDAIQKNIQSDPQYKKKFDSDDAWKDRQIEELRGQFSNSTDRLRNSIYQALITVFLVVFCAWLAAIVLVDFISFNVEKPIILVQIISASLILFALLGKLGWSIQTGGGNTIPEVINNFWFVFLNVVGGFLLFTTYFLNLFRK